MKIINTVHGTKNSVTAVVGSTSTPICSQVFPVGSQLMADSKTFLPNSGIPSAWTKTDHAPQEGQPRSADRQAVAQGAVFIRK